MWFFALYKGGIYMEYLDLYDNERNLTNEKICRGDEIPDNRFILLTCIIIENSKNELLMQFTSPEKNSVWALTGGHVTTGEDTLSTIIRETKEELGVIAHIKMLSHQRYSRYLSSLRQLRLRHITEQHLRQV